MIAAVIFLTNIFFSLQSSASLEKKKGASQLSQAHIDCRFAACFFFIDLTHDSG